MTLDTASQDYRTWPAEEDQQLIELRTSGLRFNEIASKLGRSDLSCRSRLRKLGLLIRSSPWNDELEEVVKTLWVDHSAQQIAEILRRDRGAQINKSAVIGKLRRLGLTAANKISCHAHDSYAPKEIRSKVARLPRKPRKKYDSALHKPKLRIVTNGGGGFRVEMSVTSELPLFECAEIPVRGLTFDELGPDDCRFMAGDPLNDGLFCGNPVVTGKSWCVGHCRIVFLPNAELKKRSWRLAA